MDFITTCLLQFAISLIVVLFLNRRKKRPIKIIMPSDQWIDINDTPIPQEQRDFIVTDGKMVDHCFTAYYDIDGDVKIPCTGHKVTHWIPMPQPPIKD